MTPVFLDTVGLIAAWDHRDQWHISADAVYRQLIAERTMVLTTTFVLAECANAAARRTYRDDVEALRVVLTRANCLIFPDEFDWRRAWQVYQSQGPGSPGIVDLISFEIMKKFAIVQAFTNDQHFRTAGFQPLF